MTKFHFTRVILTVSLLLLVCLQPVFAFPIPVTPGSTAATSNISQNNLSLASFVSKSSTGDGKTLVGIYAAGVFALPVVQQPQDQPGYVSSVDGQLTQFRMAQQFNSIGILAHNHLAGANFFSLQSGQVLTLVYGDGHLEIFKIAEIRDFQALSPTDPYSNFIDLSNTSVTLTATDLFMQTYGKGNVVVLQTCIAKDGEQSWGRRLIVAEPVTADNQSVALR